MKTTASNENKRDFSQLGFQLFFIALGIMAVQIISAYVITTVAPGLTENYSLYFLANMLPYYFLGIPTILYLIKRQTSAPASKHSLRFRQWFAAFCISYSLMYLSNFFGLFITQIIGKIKGSPVENVIEKVALDLNPFAAILCMVILAPIFEELLFRKFIIDKTAKYGEGIAIFISAFSFGLFHGNLNQFVYAFSLGLFWGFIYVKTRKIKYTICIHMVINFMGSVLSTFLVQSEFFKAFSALSNPADLHQVLPLISEHAAGIIVYFIYTIFLLILVVAGIILLCVNHKKIQLQSGEIVIPKGKRVQTILLNAGMLFHIIFWGIQIIAQLWN